MRPLPTRLAAVALLLLLGGCGSAASPAADPTAAAAGPPPPTRVWERASGWRDLPAAPAAAPTRAWSRDLPAGSQFAAAPGTVVVAVPAVRTGDYAGDPRTRAQVVVTALDATTGAERWRQTLEAAAVSDVRWVGSLVSVEIGGEDRGEDRRAAVLDLADGRVVWAGPSSPVVSDVGDTVLLSDLTSVAVDRTSGAELWRTDAVLTVTGGMIVRTVSAPVGSPTDLTDAAGLPRPDSAGLGEQHYELLDPRTGAPRDLGAFPTFSALSVVDDLAVVTSDGAGSGDDLTALDPTTGERRWEARIAGMERPYVSPFGPDALLLQTFGPNPVVVERGTGAVRWRSALGLTYDVLEIAGRPAIAAVQFSRDEQVVIDAAGAEVRASAPARAGGTVAGGAVYVAGPEAVQALALPHLRPLWSVPTGLVRGVSAIDGGFLVATGDSADYAQATTLVAYR
jgi:outer membrane protein assembly factor BamB